MFEQTEKPVLSHGEVHCRAARTPRCHRRAVIDAIGCCCFSCAGVGTRWGDGRARSVSSVSRVWLLRRVCYVSPAQASTRGGEKSTMHFEQFREYGCLGESTALEEHAGDVGHRMRGSLTVGGLINACYERGIIAIFDKNNGCDGRAPQLRNYPSCLIRHALNQ